MIDWNVIVTVRHDFDRALELLRPFGRAEGTNLHNVIAMRVPDPRGFLDEIAQLPRDERFFETIGHVIPITHKLWFANADELERKAREIVLGWAPVLAGKSMHVRLHRRGRRGELARHELEQQLGAALLEELERRGTPGRIAFDDPDAIVVIETLHDEAGLALWTRDDFERHPFLRTSIEGERARPRATPPPSRPASAADLVNLLGELEPLTIERLLATGASLDEVIAATLAIEDEQGFGETHHGPSSTREAEVRAILEELVFEDAEEQESEREIARV